VTDIAELIVTGRIATLGDDDPESFGWGEAIDPMVEAWRAGDRQRALEVAPEELIHEIFIFGDAGEQKLRLAEFTEKGITTAVLTPICPPDELAETIDALAP